MNDSPNIPGLRSLTPEEEAQILEYEAYVEAVVIPQIVEQDFENRKRVAEMRHLIVD